MPKTSATGCLHAHTVANRDNGRVTAMVCKDCGETPKTHNYEHFHDCAISFEFKNGIIQEICVCNAARIMFPVDKAWRDANGVSINYHIGPWRTHG